MSPLGYNLSIYVFVISLASAGAFVNFINRKHGCVRCTLISLVVDIITASFIGIIVFWICESLAIPALQSAVFIGLSGHVGTRLIFQLEYYLFKKIGVVESLDHEVCEIDKGKSE